MYIILIILGIIAVFIYLLSIDYRFYKGIRDVGKNGTDYFHVSKDRDSYTLFILNGERYYHDYVPGFIGTEGCDDRKWIDLKSKQEVSDEKNKELNSIFCPLVRERLDAKKIAKHMKKSKSIIKDIEGFW